MLCVLKKVAINSQIFSVKIETLIDQCSATYITITESVLLKKTLDEFRTCGVNEVSLILRKTKKTCPIDPLPSFVFTQCIDIHTPMNTDIINAS